MLDRRPATPPIALSASQFSCVGLRSGNQDAMGYHLDERWACFIVCDGVGGNAGGEVAARLAVDTALNLFIAKPSIDTHAITGYVAAANDAIVARQRQSDEQARMSATFVALFVDRSAQQMRWAHVGDSRLYCFHRGRMRSHTEDHSLSQRTGLDGHGDAGMPAVQRNLLYRALGAKSEVEPTIAPPLDLADGDALLLCTDGLWQLIGPPVMEKSLQLSDSAEEWLALLRRAAEAASRESDDNYSALGVWVGEPQQVTLINAGS